MPKFTWRASYHDMSIFTTPEHAMEEFSSEAEAPLKTRRSGISLTVDKAGPIVTWSLLKAVWPRTAKKEGEQRERREGKGRGKGERNSNRRLERGREERKRRQRWTCNRNGRSQPFLRSLGRLSRPARLGAGFQLKLSPVWQPKARGSRSCNPA